jgi:glycosyltransferase involved in cell wall biosynthesis
MVRRGRHRRGVSYAALWRTPGVHAEPLTNVVFAHDSWFHRGEDGRVRSARGAWPWERYLDFTRTLTVTSRMDAGGEGFEDVSREGVEFVALPSLSGPAVRFTRRREARGILERALGQADALVARLPSEIGLLAVDVAGRRGLPYAIELVTCTWDALWYRGSFQGKLYAPISWWATRGAVRRAPFVLYVTRDFLQGRYPSPGRTVACSDVDLPPVDEAVVGRRLEAIEQGGEPFVLGIVAALSVRFKGIQTALEALGSVRRRLPPFELHVVGAGDASPWRELARRHGIADRVRFEGAVPHAQMPQWLDRVDLYLQPSFQEGLPRSLLEAMSRGCPALGSTAGGIPELLERESMHRPGDARVLSGLIERATSPQWRRAQANRNFDVAREYAPPALDGLRRAFWQEFAGFARKRDGVST